MTTQNISYKTRNTYEVGDVIVTTDDKLYKIEKLEDFRKSTGVFLYYVIGVKTPLKFTVLHNRIKGYLDPEEYPEYYI